MKKIYSALVAVVAVAMCGCTLLGKPVAEKVADAVGKYCTEPFNAREVYRDTVNRELSADGHSVQVTCAGDPTE